MSPPLTTGPPPSAPGAPRPGTRLFRGIGFTLHIPQQWVDQTTYMLAGPKDGEMIHHIWITPDLKPRITPLSSYVNSRIHALTQTANGWLLSQMKEIEMAPGLKGIQADLRWSPTEHLVFYQKQIYVTHQEINFTIHTQMTKRSKLTLGPAIERAMLTFRPAALAAARPAAPPRPAVPSPGTPQAPAGDPIRTDLFVIAPGDGWTDASLYILGEGEEGKFRRNVVLRRETPAEPPESIEQQARAEAELMEQTVAGFELIEEGPVKSPDGGPAHKLVFRRHTSEKRLVRQTQVLAWRDPHLFIGTLTTEETMAEELRKSLGAIPESFSTAPAAGATQAGQARV